MKLRSFKVLSIILCLTLMLGLAGCSPATEVQEEGIYNAGVYTGVSKGHNGEIKVEVELSKDEIISVKVVEHVESAGISDVAIERIPQEVVAGQTLAIDTVSGSTFSSNAILAAIEEAVKQAGGDIEALKASTQSETGGKEITEINTEVVVIGAGGAGLVAAASAHENGAEVIVLEKQATVGGSTALSGGGISATGTRFQEERGIEDTKQSWMELWKERQATSNPDGLYPNYEFVDQFMDAAVVTTEWLTDYVGHEYGAVMGYGVDPVERLHFPVMDGSAGGGTVLIQNIETFVKSEGIDVLTETPAKELITDEKGNVIGVLAEGREGEVKIYAKKIILAAGGFAKNEELLERLVPKAVGTAAMSAAAAGSMGDGILMAEKVGAELYEEPWVIGLGVATKVPGTQSLMMDWSKVYVNEKGERFTSEEIHYAIATNKILEQDQPWAIIDSAESNILLLEAAEAGLSTGEVVKAETLEVLAEEMNVPVEVFVETMSTFNEGVASGNDSMGKSKDYLFAIEKAPYYAIKLYGKTMGTFAGVKTNDDFQVLNTDGDVISNLYAVGENANRILYNQVYMSGSAVQFALTSGRLAGAHAAQTLE